jgi:hypothetical protein
MNILEKEAVPCDNALTNWIAMHGQAPASEVRLPLPHGRGCVTQRDPDFQAGRFDTSFIYRFMPVAKTAKRRQPGD